MLTSINDSSCLPLTISCDFKTMHHPIICIFSNHPTTYIKEMIPFEHQLNQTFTMNTFVHSVTCIFIRNACKSIIVLSTYRTISRNTGTGAYLIYILNRFITLVTSAQRFSIPQVHVCQTKQSCTMPVSSATSFF